MVNLYPGNPGKDNKSFKKAIITPAPPAFTASIELYSSRLKWMGKEFESYQKIIQQ